MHGAARSNAVDVPELTPVFNIEPVVVWVAVGFMLSNATRVTVVCIVSAVALWLVVRRITDAAWVQLVTLIGVGVWLPTVLAKRVGR